MVKKKVAVIGAGVGGLASAARCAHRGCHVEVFEKLSRCGGRAHIIEDKGFKFDTGPSFVLMPSFFEEVFTDCGVDIKDYLDLRKLAVSYTIFFGDGEIMTIYRDSAKTKQEMEKFEPGSSAAFDRFIEDAAKIYHTVEPLLYKCFTSADIFNAAYWPLLFKLQPFRTYWQMAKKYFKTDKICYAMTFEAMFIGLSPFKTPLFYSVITYADHVDKIAHPMGGMYQVPLALEKLGKQKGAVFHYDQEVLAVEDAPAGKKNIITKKGSFLFDAVVINADYAYAQTDLLKRSIPSYQYSCSVYLLYLGLSNKIRLLEHHNLFFAKDLKQNLREIFQTKELSVDPSFYVHVPTVTDPSLAPKNKEIIYILVPVPNLRDPHYDQDMLDRKIRPFVFHQINKATGKTIEDLIEVEHAFYPQDFIGRYNVKHGATFGLAHSLMQSAFFRPSNKDAKRSGLYYVGASTQPGGGLPPVLASSKIVADMIVEG